MERLKENLCLLVLVFLFLTAAGIWFVVFGEERGDILTVAFLDVGQGDSIYIEAPNGNQVLIDGGGSKEVLRALGKVMPIYDRSIDLVIATHPDQDHIGGLPFVLERYTVATLIDPGVAKDSGAYRSLRAHIDSNAVDYIQARRGQKMILDDGVALTILFPDRDMHGSAANNASIVAKLTYGTTSFLLSGDAPKSVEEYLVDLDGTYLDVDVLKAGHHGSRTSSGTPFLEAASPQFVAISAAKNNRYGHPHQETLDRIRETGAILLGTYDGGTIRFFSDGQKIGLK